MQIHWSPEIKSYDGSQLKSLFAYLNYGILGDSIVGWRGPCEISWHHMVDGEDIRMQSPIRGQDMLHFIVELFDCSLFAAVHLQRLMATMAANLIEELSSVEEVKINGVKLIRQGDDLYWKERKLSVSVATIGARSALIHFALNITNEGTPVPTCSLSEWQIDPLEFALKWMEQISKEVKDIKLATYKVRPVGSF